MISKITGLLGLGLGDWLGKGVGDGLAEELGLAEALVLGEALGDGLGLGVESTAVAASGNTKPIATIEVVRTTFQLIGLGWGLG